jgi:hypothetical protein
MAGTALLINSRRRRRRKARRARSSRKRTRRVRRNPFAVARRRRRRGHRRAHARRRGRRRVHRNPRGFKLPGIGHIPVMQIGAGAAGYIFTAWGGPQLFSMLPAEWSADPKTKPMIQLAAKAAVGLVVVPMLAKAIFPRKGLAGPLALGAGIAIAVDLFKQYIAPSIPGFSMGDYETQTISAYETARLTGDADAFGNSAYSGGGADSYAY